MTTRSTMVGFGGTALGRIYEPQRAAGKSPSFADGPARFLPGRAMTCVSRSSSIDPRSLVNRSELETAAGEVETAAVRSRTCRERVPFTYGITYGIAAP